MGGIDLSLSLSHNFSDTHTGTFEGSCYPEVPRARYTVKSKEQGTLESRPNPESIPIVSPRLPPLHSLHFAPLTQLTLTPVFIASSSKSIIHIINQSHAVVKEIIRQVSHARVAVAALNVLAVRADDHARRSLADEHTIRTLGRSRIHSVHELRITRRGVFTGRRRRLKKKKK